MKGFNLIVIITSVLILSACGGGTTSEVIVSKIEANKKKQKELKEELVTLEKELLASGDSTLSNSKIKIKDVVLLSIQPKEFNHYLEIQGRVESSKNVMVSAMAAGTITKIHVNRGDVVKKGSLLASIDDEIIRKGIDELQTNITLSKTIFEKQKTLWEQKIGTEIQYLQVKTTYEGLLKRMEQLKEQQSAYRIKATIDGTVDELYPNEGEVTAPGAPAFRLINTSGFKATADIAEGYINKVKKGNKVVLYFPDLDISFDTYVKVISDVISPVNRSFSVEFDLKNAPKNIKANMLVYVKILDYSKQNAIVVPVNIIQHTDAADFVYTVKDKKAIKTEVKTGSIYRTEAEIEAGLKAGDQVVITGYQDMVDGQVVNY